MHTISAFWGDRPASREAVAQALSHFLTALAAIDPNLTGWRPQAGSRKAALAKAALSLDAASLEVRLRVQRTDFERDPMPELGYSFSAWNGRASDNAASISCTAGLHAGTPNLRNRVVVNMPRKLRRESAFRDLTSLMRESWQPDEVVLFSESRTVLWQRG